MKKSFDERLSEHIRATFEVYEAPFNEQDWTKMKATLDRKKETKRLPAKMSFLHIAAVAGGIFLTLSLLFALRKPPKPTQTDANVRNTSYLPAIRHCTPLSDTTNQAVYQEITQHPLPIHPTQTSHDSGSQSLPPEQIISETYMPELPDSLVLELIVATDTLKPREDSITVQQIANQDNNHIKNNVPHTRIRLRTDVLLSTSGTLSNEKMTSGKGYGAGIITRLPLMKRLCLESGVILAYQEYTTNTTQINKVSYSNKPRESSTSSDARLLAMDIPLNVRFQLGRSSHEGFHVGAGFSSLAFLNQDIAWYKEDTRTVYQLKQGSATLSSNEQSESGKISGGAFSHFDLAGILNLSAGYTKSLGQGSLIIEPFFKLPLTGLSSGNLNYGSGGIALRYQFR